jgi:hypothetical protein
MATPMRETGKVHNWLPFHSEDEARHALLTYAIHANMPDAALIWTDATGAKLLQQGTADKDGDVKVLIAHAHGPIPPPVVPPPPPSMLDSFENTVAKLLDGAAADAKAAGSAITGAAKSAGQDAVSGWKTANKFVDEHPFAFDGVATGFDIIAVVGGFLAVGALGVSLGGAIGLIALGAGVTLLAADGSHFAMEVIGQKLASFKRGAEWEEHNPIFETVQWVAPILCLPDLAYNAPRAIRAVGQMAQKATEAGNAAAHAAADTDKAVDRLVNYIQKRENDPAHPLNASRIEHYRAQITKAQHTQVKLNEKFDEAATEARKAVRDSKFTGVGITGTAYGFGTMAAHAPNRDGYVKSTSDYAQSAIAAGWYDLGSWFTPIPPTYPVMPDAGSRVYHGGFHGGYFSRVGADPWSDMQSYLSIHIAVARMKPR